MDKIKFIAAIFLKIKDLGKDRQEQIINDIKNNLGEEQTKSSPQIYSVEFLDDLPYPVHEGDVCYVAEVLLPGTYKDGLWVFNVPKHEYETIAKFRNLSEQPAAPPPFASTDA